MGIQSAPEERLIRKNGAIPSSLHYEGYPCSICASINDEVVHGIPSERRILQEGDVVSIDCTLLKDGAAGLVYENGLLGFLGVEMSGSCSCRL